MNRKLKYELCRLCLCSGGQLIDIFEEDNKLEFMVEKTIEDLLNLKVVKETMYPWLVCSPCLTKLTEFRLFKRRCVECQFVFQNRVEKGDFSEVEDWESIQEKVTVKAEEYDLDGEVASDLHHSGDECFEDRLQNQNISVEESVYEKTPKEELEYVSGNGNKMVVSGEGRSIDETWTNRESMETIVASEVSAKEEIESLVSEEMEMDPQCGFEETEMEVPVKLEKNYVDLSATNDLPGRYSSYFGDKATGFAVQGTEFEDSGEMCVPSKKSPLVTGVDSLTGADPQNPSLPERASYSPAPLEVLANWCKLAAMKRTTCSASCLRPSEPSVPGGSSSSCTSSDVHIIRMNSSLYPDMDKPLAPDNSDSFAAFSTSRTQPTEGNSMEGNGRVSGFGETEAGSFNEMASGNNAVQSPVPCALHVVETGGTQRVCMTEEGERIGLDEPGSVTEAKPTAGAYIDTINWQSDAETNLCRISEISSLRDSNLDVSEVGSDEDSGTDIQTEGLGFQCDVCGSDFGTKGALVNHMWLHISGEVFRCGICGVDFRDIANFDVHNESVHRGTAGFERMNRTDQRREGKIVEEEGSGIFYCAICSRSFKHKGALCKHAMVHNRKRRYTCNVCLRDFKRQGNLNAHMSIHTGVKAHVCDVCGTAFGHKSTLLRHILVHTGEKKFSCTVCSRTFQRGSHLQNHMVVHTKSKPYSCELCHKSFSQETILRRHMDVHLEERPYICGICAKAYQTKLKLKAHMKIHSLVKRHECAQCPKTFSAHSQLQRHLTVHSGLKPYSCTECSKAFTQKTSLKAHMVVHTGRKPHDCKVCGKAFTLRDSLRKHMASHDAGKRHGCDVCGKSFVLQGNLKNHMVVHMGQKPYSCVICAKSFSRKAALQEHMFLHVDKSASVHCANKDIPEQESCMLIEQEMENAPNT